MAGKDVGKGEGSSGASFSGANAPRAGAGPEEGEGLMKFKIEFLRYENGKRVYRIFIDPSNEEALAEWLIEKAKEALEKALQQLNYHPREVCPKTYSLDKAKARKLYNIASKLFGKYKVITKTSKSLWYRLGLALTDGTITEGGIIFGTTTKELTFCVIRAWPEATVSFHGISPSKDGLIPSIRICVPLRDMKIFLKMALREPSNFAKVLESDEEKRNDFLAGAVDGDGCVQDTSVIIIAKIGSRMHKILEILGDSGIISKRSIVTRKSLFGTTGQFRYYGIYARDWGKIYQRMEHPERKNKLKHLISHLRKKIFFTAYRAGRAIMLYCKDKNLLIRLTGKNPYQHGSAYIVYTADHETLKKCLPLVDEKGKEVITNFLKEHNQKQLRRTRSWKRDKAKAPPIWVHKGHRCLRICSFSPELLARLVGRTPYHKDADYWYIYTSKPEILRRILQYTDEKSRKIIKEFLEKKRTNQRKGGPSPSSSSENIRQRLEAAYP